jgi:hypothetical protein
MPCSLVDTYMSVKIRVVTQLKLCVPSKQFTLPACNSILLYSLHGLLMKLSVTPAVQCHLVG